jgi:hypothetical protein
MIQFMSVQSHLHTFYSHERKKKYWEQLELRCRHLYRRPPHCATTSNSAIMMTPASAVASQCGYCSTADDPARYYNAMMHPPELCPGGLWAPATSIVASETNMPADACYWNPSMLSNSVGGNFYSPNPETSHSLSSNNLDEVEAENGGRLRSSMSRSFRNWFPWLSNRIASMNSVNNPTAAASSVEASAGVQMRPSRPPVNLMWRHSNPDSHYGFRVAQPQNGGYHRGHGGLGYMTSSGTTPADLSHYAAIPSDHLPRYLWGPPPPYSQPPSIENIREAAEAITPSNPDSDQHQHQSLSIQPPVTSVASTASPGASRTTRSGILADPNKEYDETVKSAMHLYERANNVINSNSLPSRRLRKNNMKAMAAKSVANLQRSMVEEEEAALFSEVRQKLNALNGMYRYQHSKAAIELAEIRRALNSLQTSGPVTYKQQNVPLPPIPNLIYQPPSVVSNNSCSTENKYETIGKSLQPYKINNEESSKKRLPSSGSSYSSGSSGSRGGGGESDPCYGFSSSVSPMSVTIAPNGSQSPSSSSDEAVAASNRANRHQSSHYAQISPLRGQGLPHPSIMGLQNNGGPNSVMGSPVKSYFQVINIF